jgi:putative spermidine/putrescine transport system substrate-binding protein
MLIEAGNDELRINISRRELLRAVGAVAAAGALSAASPSSSQAAASELNILFTGGTWKQYFDEVFVVPFAKQKGIRVVYSLGDFNRQLSRVIAERQNQRSDLLHMHQFNAAALEALNLIVPPDPKIVTNLADVSPSFRFPAFVGKVLTPFGVAYNTKKITRKISSWKDLWDPAFTGKVAIPKWEWIGSTWFYAANRVWGGDENNIDPGIKACHQLINDRKAVIMNNVDHGATLYSNEEIWISPHYNARTAQLKARGVPVEFVYPEEGALNWLFNVGILKGRPADSETLAQEFVNYTLDPEAQVQFASKIGYPPTNSKAIAMLPKDSPLIVTPAQVENLGRLRLDFGPMIANRDAHAERWNKEVIGG